MVYPQLMRRAAVSVAALSVGLAMSASPAAAASGASPVPPTGAPPAPGVSQASVTLSFPDAFSVQGEAVSVSKRTVHVVGVVRPYVPGQSVQLRAFLGGRMFKSRAITVDAAAGGAYGRFTEPLSSPGVGEVIIKVFHARTAAQQSFLARGSFSALDASIRFGATGRFVQLVQQRLAALHFYIPQTGVYDQGTGLAIDAYHRLLGWGASQVLDDRTTSRLLDGSGAFQVRYREDGKHVEGDVSRQLVALIDGSKVGEIYPISSGKSSTPTILGRFSVYQKTPGYLPDGMYYSNFFYGGYAIHGYSPAPDYPASHGCMRLPIVDAISVYDWVRLGTRVDVYR